MTNSIICNIPDLSYLNIESESEIHYQLSPESLIQQSLELNQAQLNDTGALVVNTGRFTGRSPKDKFIVNDMLTNASVHWNDFNIPIEAKYFDSLYTKITKHLKDKQIWVRDASVCAGQKNKVNVRVINDTPWANLFCFNMFIRPKEEELTDFKPEWTIIQAPSFKADPETDDTRSENFSIINFSKKIILIGGTAYTGEMKKGMFTVLNFTLPFEKKILSMHCSANMGEDGTTALFFGLSGTGKTTLSADPDRKLIGDDEHGWSDENIFNFEGGCYAKCIDLSKEKEPQIFNAIRSGALVENTVFVKDSDEINFASKEITENTRVSYPLDYISNAIEPSIGNNPKNIFFLTCDAYGVLPPISRLSARQAMYHFLSGYTAKIAGTEAGITEPVSTFSTCFGAPFLPLHPVTYAEMLGEKIEKNKVKVWLINTGWTGGAYGTGERIKLTYTRSMIKAVLENKLDNINFYPHPIFKTEIPEACPEVPAILLNPINTWKDKVAYTEKAQSLAAKFIANFVKYQSVGYDDLSKDGPVV
ncbi:phosphoenolpyruvate carboxykinase (ATP) [Desertivirga xinjiangensis]|uniref:phosphoenolpyruvate carboxykinase (ATP) n=1 Tax=Desertivirga xinjiangensis TaxID=539206 RepID=UPI0021088945|nr:phosphoenolpyruvate carboxykinase (ATP) [Pedobacter xinjiangensis]